MVRKILLLLMIAVFCTGSALAEQPHEIYPLDYEALPETKEGQHHYLFACIDEWNGQADNLGNTDGMIMITFDNAAKRLMFTTYSREMLIQRPDGKIGRITYIAKNYGVDALCHIVSTHFGTKVDKYIVFSMDNIQQIISALGGVYITVTDAEADYLNRYRISRDSTTPSMDKAGTYLFGGHAAVIYMRIRKVGGDGDSGRTRRMRTVIQTLAEKYKDITLAEALNVLNAVTSNKLLTNLTFAEMVEAVGYAMALRGIEPEGIQMPLEEAMEPIIYSGMMTRQVDFEMCRKALYAFLGSSDTASSPAQNEDFLVVE